MVVSRLSSAQWPSSYRGWSHDNLEASMRQVFPGTDGDRLLARPTEPSRQARLRSLLVPLDGTPLSERALPLAISIAKRAQAKLRIVHVRTPMDSVYYPTPLAFEVGEYPQKVDYLERLSQQMTEASGITVIPECLEQRDIVEGLCEVADQGADLVVTATHGFGWWKRLWYGSTVHKLIERLTPPLLILRGDGLRPAIAPNRWLRRMLVPLDGSEASESILNVATALGSLYDARYSLLTVVPLSYTIRRTAIDYDAAWAVHRQSFARNYLGRALDRMKQNSTRAMTRMAVTEEPVAQAIVSRAEASRIDCIAMATSGRSGLKRWFQPSITQRVIRLSQVPVLVVRGGQDVAGA